jgi:DNA-binding transcriptional regulator YhcF (GntR family)
VVFRKTVIIPVKAGRIARRGPKKQLSIRQDFAPKQCLLCIKFLPASVGLAACHVNAYLISYIRHITEHFLLDGKRGFMVKSQIMSSLPSQPVNNGATSAGTATSSGVSPTFSPLYQQIKSLITQSLQSGEWKPGELIPSEVELATRFKVSQGTVRKAIDELSAENLVVRRQGKGTFVATHHEPTTSSKSSACARRPKWRGSSTSNPAIP